MHLAGVCLWNLNSVMLKWLFKLTVHVINIYFASYFAVSILNFAPVALHRYAAGHTVTVGLTK